MKQFLKAALACSTLGALTSCTLFQPAAATTDPNNPYGATGAANPYGTTSSYPTAGGYNQAAPYTPPAGNYGGYTPPATNQPPVYDPSTGGGGYTDTYSGGGGTGGGSTGGGSASSGSSHRVVRGDTLSALSRRYGVSVADLMRANNLTSDRINVGQSISIP